MKNIKSFSEFMLNESKVKKIEKNYGVVEVSDNGVVKSVVDYNGKKVGELYVDEKMYRYNTKYKTYNSVSNNDLLTDKDLDSVELDIS